MENTRKNESQSIFYSVNDVMELMDCSRRKAEIMNGGVKIG